MSLGTRCPLTRQRFSKLHTEFVRLLCKHSAAPQFQPTILALAPFVSWPPHRPRLGQPTFSFVQPQDQVEFCHPLSSLPTWPCLATASAHTRHVSRVQPRAAASLAPSCKPDSNMLSSQSTMHRHPRAHCTQPDRVELVRVPFAQITSAPCKITASTPMTSLEQLQISTFPPTLRTSQKPLSRN